MERSKSISIRIINKIKNLKKNTFYEYKVVAYRKVDGKKVAIGKSLELHAVTASKSYKYSNPTSIKVKQKTKSFLPFP